MDSHFRAMAFIDAFGEELRKHLFQDATYVLNQHLHVEEPEDGVRLFLWVEPLKGLPEFVGLPTVYFHPRWDASEICEHLRPILLGDGATEDEEETLRERVEALCMKCDAHEGIYVRDPQKATN